jgi:hypothetical protein
MRGLNAQRDPASVVGLLPDRPAQDELVDVLFPPMNPTTRSLLFWLLLVVVGLAFYFYAGALAE